MQGRRLRDGFHYFDSQAGDYWKQFLGTRELPGEKFLWTIKDPQGHLGTISDHEVTEHEDGTITVSPSILDTSTYGVDKTPGFHGYLERGAWRSC